MIPERLQFYENWLTPPGLRDGKFGLAPLHAVLSFLRREGQTSYEQVMERAGRYTADWGYAEVSSIERALVRSVPPWVRARWALRICRRLVQQTFKGSNAVVRVRKNTGTMDIRASIFCAVRETAAFPMCRFYSAAVERFLQRFDIDAQVDLRQCKASGGNACTIAVTIRGQHVEEPAAEAA